MPSIGQLFVTDGATWSGRTVSETGADVVTCPVASVAAADRGRLCDDATIGATRLSVALGAGMVRLVLCAPSVTTIEATPRSSEELTVTGMVLPARNDPDKGDVIDTVGAESTCTVTGTVTGLDTCPDPSCAVNDRMAGPIAAVDST